MKPIKLIVQTHSRKYPILIGSNLVSKVDFFLKNNSIKFNKCFFLIDSKVPNKFVTKIKKKLKKRKLYFHTFNANEKNKDQNTINKILNILLKENFTRQDCLVSVGGGITGDVGGFAASLFKRGLQFINMPTTLLSQVDSSIGGKTGINSKYGKNLIGSFYQPKLVISDSDFLKSLPQKEIICGYGEILKHSIIADKKFFSYLNKNIEKILKLQSPFIEKSIYISCKIKKKVVEKDETENNLRKILNFGHTFAHAYEATMGYSKKLNHGEAVLLGINTALNFSLKNHFISKDEYSLIIEHMRHPKIVNNIRNYFSQKHLDKILSFILKDKKNKSEKINLILLKKIGRPIIHKTYNINKVKIFLKKELTN